MTTPEFVTGDIIVIAFDDSFFHVDNYWHGPEDFDYSEAATMTTVGYLVCQSERFLTVAQTVNAVTDDEYEYGAAFSIPTGAIVKMTKLN